MDDDKTIKIKLMTAIKEITLNLSEIKKTVVSWTSFLSISYVRLGS